MSATVLDQIGEHADLTVAEESSVTLGDPVEREISSRSPQSREQRGQQLANQFVKFVGEMVPLLIQVRQDFLEKSADETICGVRTFDEYCTGILRYSRRRIQQLIAGQNPASQKHDGSAHRKPKTESDQPEPPNPEPARAHKAPKDPEQIRAHDKAARELQSLLKASGIEADVSRSKTDGKFHVVWHGVSAEQVHRFAETFKSSVLLSVENIES